jgi:hypothetical protein
MISLCGAFAFCLVRYYFNGPLIHAIVAAGVAALNPAVLHAYYSPSMGFDIAASVFCFGAFFLIIKGYVWGSIVILTLSLFTKETTAFAPLSAALMFLFLSRKSDSGVTRHHYIKAGLIFLVPILACLAVRHLAFEGQMGVYVFNGISQKGVFKKLISALCTWPLGLNGEMSVKQSIVALYQGQFESVSFPLLAVLLLNITVLLSWAAYIVLLVRDSAFRKQNTDVVLVMPWLLGNLACLLGVGTASPRFGYFLFAAGVPTLLTIVSRASKHRRLWYGVTAISLLTIVGRAADTRFDKSAIPNRNRQRQTRFYYESFDLPCRRVVKD